MPERLMNIAQTATLRVAIVGAGFSGSMVATHLLRQDQHVHLDMVDLRIPGRGLAYSTVWDEHLLNVRAGRMSAFGSDPEHFLEWLRKNGRPEATSDSFVPRKVFGSYLQDILQSAIHAAPAKYRFRHHGSRVVQLSHDGLKARVLLASGERITADQVVLALGNPAPRPLEAARERYHNTPWEDGALTGLHPKATVLLLGAGLTAVDAFLALDALGHQGDIYCLSRRGKLPHVHTVYQAPEEPFAPLGINSARCLLRELRREVEEAQRRGYDWRGVVDSLRPITNEIWEDFSLREKSRVFRHLKTWWDIHRHRMAPEIGAKLNSALACRRLRVVAGRLKRITPEKDNLRVEITQRSQAGISLLADRLINCTGSEEDYQRSPNLLVRSLLESGRIRSNPTGKGLWTDADGALIDSKGVVSDWLFTLGPPRTGGLFETTAVPEVRIQAEALAHRLVSTPYQAPEIPIEHYVAAGI